MVPKFGQNDGQGRAQSCSYVFRKAPGEDF